MPLQSPCSRLQRHAIFVFLNGDMIGSHAAPIHGRSTF